MRSRLIIGAVGALALAGAIVTVRTVLDAPVPVGERPVELISERPCPDSEFTCVTLRVPRDHFGPANGPTLDVTFARLPATGGERRGAFVIAVGGPGQSGIALADSYTETFDSSIGEHFDIVFFDQRGVGESEPIECIDAISDYYATDAVPTRSTEAAAAFAVASRAFSQACVEEIGLEPAALEAFATVQVAEDLEHFRRWLGAEALDLYGESYGTQLVQVYAAAHPDHVASLMLDGPVDLTIEGTDYWAEGSQAFTDALAHTLDACDEVCVEDLEGDDLGSVWDRLVTEVADEPVAYSMTLADGSQERRELTLAGLESAVAAYVYDTFDRMLLQRAIAYAARDELEPIGRLALIGLGQDPQTLETYDDPTWSDALYYAVQCMDYAYGNGNADEREAAYLAQGQAIDIAAVPMGSVFYGDLPCATWPVHAPSDPRPAYLATDAYPIFILASTTDPATPYAGARRIFDNAGNGYLVTQPGGPHVIYGRGNACPDDLVTAWLVDRELPDEREVECDPMLPDPYVPLPPASISADDDPIWLLLSVDDELYFMPDLWTWAGDGKLAVGCLHGGVVRYVLNDVGLDVSLTNCEVIDGLPLSGTGVIDEETGWSTFHLTSPGGTDVDYERDADYNVTIEGTWFGEPVDLEG